MKLQPSTLDTIRNIGIISHIDAGKTTLSERILYYTGAIHRMGEVHEGEAEMDWMPQEQERGITITATATWCRWKGWWINLVDTPGHVDFTIEVERSLRALDGAVAVISAVEGVQPQTVTVWRQADRYGVPRICFINKMDRVGADWEGALRRMEETLGATPLPLQIPVGEEGGFAGVVDLIGMRALFFDEGDAGRTVTGVDVPESLRGVAERFRERLLERLADIDDGILETFLAGEEPGEEAIRRAIRRGTIDGRFIPVFLGSALRNRGVQPVLDGIGEYLPSPLDRREPTGVTAEGESVSIPADPAIPPCALAFKVRAEAGRKLTWLRLYAGTVTQGMALWNVQRGCFEKVGRLFRMQADRKEGIDSASAGDIVAVGGFRETLTGDTLCSPERKILLDGMSIPEPVVSLAVEPKSSHQRDELADALLKLSWEDPTFRVREDPETGQTVISGMGELHLEIILDRLQRDFGIGVAAGRPQVVHRETIAHPVTHRELFHHEVEGKTIHGEVHLSAEPLPRGSGCRVALDPSVTVMRDRLSDILQQTLSGGGSTGYPLTDLEITVDALPWEQGITSEQGVLAAMGRGVPALLRKGGGILLEPVMRVEVTVPREYAGRIIGGLQQKRGRIEGMTDTGGEEIIRAIAPLSELFGYMTELRSATKGAGSFTMEFHSYEPAPEVQGG